LIADRDPGNLQPLNGGVGKHARGQFVRGLFPEMLLNTGPEVGDWIFHSQNLGIEADLTNVALDRFETNPFSAEKDFGPDPPFLWTPRLG
jgi:hypothetical protein